MGASTTPPISDSRSITRSIDPSGVATPEAPHGPEPGPMRTRSMQDVGARLRTAQSRCVGDDRHGAQAHRQGSDHRVASGESPSRPSSKRKPRSRKAPWPRDRWRNLQFQPVDQRLCGRRPVYLSIAIKAIQPSTVSLLQNEWRIPTSRPLEEVFGAVCEPLSASAAPPPFFRRAQVV